MSSRKVGELSRGDTPPCVYLRNSDRGRLERDTRKSIGDSVSGHQVVGRAWSRPEADVILLF